MDKCYLVLDFLFRSIREYQKFLRSNNWMTLPTAQYWKRHWNWNVLKEKNASLKTDSIWHFCRSKGKWVTSKEQLIFSVWAWMWATIGQKCTQATLFLSLPDEMLQHSFNTTGESHIVWRFSTLKNIRLTIIWLRSHFGTSLFQDLLVWKQTQ